MKKLLFILLVISNAVCAQYENFEIDALVSPKQILNCHGQKKE